MPQEFPEYDSYGRYGLMHSTLIPFKAPASNGVLCTGRVLLQIQSVSVLAEWTSEVVIGCSPNIWRHEHLAKDFVQRLYLGYPALSSSPSNSDVSFDDYQDFHQEIIPFREEKKLIIAPNSRFFVIKSFSAADVEASVRHGIWTSTVFGNKRLNDAYQETTGEIFLFFSVNGSSKFCGIAKMTGGVDFSRASNIWLDAPRWKGIFPLEWLIYKEIANKNFRFMTVPSNENKPVTSSRDTQELPAQVGITMLNIFSTYRA